MLLLTHSLTHSLTHPHTHTNNMLCTAQESEYKYEIERTNRELQEMKRKYYQLRRREEADDDEGDDVQAGELVYELYRIDLKRSAELVRVISFLSFSVFFPKLLISFLPMLSSDNFNSINSLSFFLSFSLPPLSSLSLTLTLPFPCLFIPLPIFCYPSQPLLSIRSSTCHWKAVKGAEGEMDTSYHLIACSLGK